MLILYPRGPTGQILHGSTKTTRAVRAAIQRSKASILRQPLRQFLRTLEQHRSLFKRSSIGGGNAKSEALSVLL
jgi:hypothetical protein